VSKPQIPLSLTGFALAGKFIFLGCFSLVDVGGFGWAIGFGVCFAGIFRRVWGNYTFYMLKSGHYLGMGGVWLIGFVDFLQKLSHHQCHP
jgi:hypothetical protein